MFEVCVRKIFQRRGEDDFLKGKPKTGTDHTNLWLDSWSGKMCLNCSYRDFIVTELDTDYWKKSFYGYPVLGHVVWLEIHMKINTSKLSPNTAYTAYLEFRLSDYVCYGIHLPIEASVGISGEEITKETVYFDHRIPMSESNCHCPYTKWMEAYLNLNFLPPPASLEVKLGDYFNKEGENRDVEIIMKEVKGGRHKFGIHFASIEMRPKRLANLKF
ncbi:hypothetical protein POM88_049243 [Heracleum sosnowskyi]|uniref:Uncharacterized protein n=1 Tax=Heracleum sosnowskyi TaxID=360622 RepID=A0AAD8GVA1_9APIA|nr:hypothetical protein POM88_049243 [Heracleum sosnowskyi]